MLTIQPGINQNTYLSPSFGKKNKNAESRLSPEEIEMRRAEAEAELEKLKAEKERRRAEAEARIEEQKAAKEKREFEQEKDTWASNKETFENIAANTEAKIPKSVKTAAVGGAILAGGVLAGMATGWSAKYIIETFQKMGKTETIKALNKTFKENISTPLKNAYKSSKKYIALQFAKMKKSDNYISVKEKYTDISTKYKKSAFNQGIQSGWKKFKENKIVSSVINFFDKIFNKFADGVVYIYSKIAGTNVKSAVANTAGVAGGVSTVGVSVMEKIKKPEENDADGPNYMEDLPENEVGEE